MTPEGRMWRAVILQVFDDARLVAKNKYVRKGKNEKERIKIIADVASTEFWIICSMAQWDYVKICRRVYEILNKGLI